MQLDPVGNCRHRRVVSLRMGMGAAVAVLMTIAIQRPLIGFRDLLLDCALGFAVVTSMMYVIFTILSFLPKK